jgi:cell wall-associated NlpC family hydrolase
MTLLRSQIVAKAKSFIGTPWKHQGRSRRAVDCVGLVIAIADELGVLPPDLVIPPYRRVPDGSLEVYFKEHMDRRPKTALKPGMVLLHSFMTSPFHASILIDPDTGTIIHGYARHRKVVLDLFKGRKDGMTLHAVYDYRGVQDG